MKAGARAWIAAVAAFVPFPLLALLATWWRDLSGTRMWILWIAMIVLGLATAALVFHYLRSRRPRGQAGAGLVKLVDEVFALAKHRLKRSGRPGVASTRTIVLMGPAGGTKTTLVEQSDLGAELLVGEVTRGEDVVPTEVANVWMGGDALFVEVGTDVLADDQSWRRLISRLRPRRWAATLGRGSLPPRSVVVCVPMSELLTLEGLDFARDTAAELRERLTELSSGLGVELPVYVVFTKVDRVPYFPDFASVFEEGEVDGVLGATLPFELDLGSEAYGERQTRRVHDAFDRLYRSLARARLPLLARDDDPDGRLGAYEFPRELNKVRDLVTRFLVDVGRPAQLTVGPQLRGFYFTGVRAVEVATPGTPAYSTPAPDVASLDATQIFSPRDFQPQTTPAQAAGTRQVPEWLFTRRLLNEVVGRDETADSLTGSGLLVHVARRAVIAAAVVALLVGIVGTTVSFRRNATLTAQALGGVEAVSVIPEAVEGLPTLDQLRALDSLRQVSARLTGFETEGKPWSYRWGLYRGDRLRQTTRRVYFDRFQRLLLADARTTIVDGLEGLADEGGAMGRADAYDALKAYLITAGHADRSTPEFLAPELLDAWQRDRAPSQEMADLVRAQFAFYATELALEDPFAFRPHPPLVESAQAFIRSFADDGRYYGAMVDEASRQAEPVVFAELYPDAAGVVTNEVRVPGAFTAPGWAFVQGQLADIDALLSLEDWVVGGEPMSAEERQALAVELERRYEAEYVDRWMAFLEGTSVPRSGGIGAASSRLEALSDRQSPLLRVLALVSEQTDVDSAVAAAFQPAHLVVAPGQDPLIGEGNQAYVDGLAAIRTALGPLAAGGSAVPDQGALTEVASSADQAENAVRQVAQGFGIEGPAGQVGDAVQRLMDAPIQSVRGLARGLPGDQANAAGAQFCGGFDALTAKYPFTTAGVAATLDEFVAMFKPGESSLWSFYDRSLVNLLERRGSRFEAIPGATPSPTPELVRFFNDAATVSSSLFTEAGDGPELALALRILTSDRLTEVEVNIDGQVHRFTRTSPGIQAFQWSADRARNATISGVLDGEPVRLVEPESGQWALFRLFQIAEWEPMGSGTYRVRWPLPAHNLELQGEVSLNASTPILSRQFLSGLRCMSRTAG